VRWEKGSSGGGQKVGSKLFSRTDTTRRRKGRRAGKKGKEPKNVHSEGDLAGDDGTWCKSYLKRNCSSQGIGGKRGLGREEEKKRGFTATQA